MYAIVEDKKIIETFGSPKKLIRNNVRYSTKIYSLWTVAEKKAIGLYEVEEDNSKKKDTDYYVNTDQTIAYKTSGDKVTATYGTATAKAHADTKWTQSEIDAGQAPAGADTNTVRLEGLKTILIRQVKTDAKSNLKETDWYVTRKAEEDTAIPSSITTHRKAVRTKQAAMETAITNAADTPALETLYTRNDSGVRPLGDLPTLE